MINMSDFGPGPIPWDRGTWTHPPLGSRAVGDELHVQARDGSDAWRHTSYGFVHDSEHALLTDLPPQSAMEVDFWLDYSGQFDQAGIFLRVSETVWIKAGVEVSDGEAQAGAVVTRDFSDWSVAPVPDLTDRRVTVRLSRGTDAVTIRIRVDDEPFRMLRLVPLAADEVAAAGPYCCAPSRAGLEVRFTRWAATGADQSLH